MDNLTKKTKSKLKLHFILAIAISVILFILTVAYTQKYAINNSNIALERYGIILTLIGIPLSLKLFHSNMKKISIVDMEAYLKKYTVQYYIRLLILMAICIFNIVALFFTGSKNFYFMVIITIFAYFLCTPQKSFANDTSTTDKNEETE